MQDTPEKERRRWADVAVIIVGLGLFGFAVWVPPFTEAGEVRHVLSLWQIYALAGGLTLAALFVGQRWRWRTFARLMLLAAVVVLTIGLFTAFRDLGPAAWLTAVLPAILLVVAIPFFGPMPRPPER